MTYKEQAFSTPNTAVIPEPGPGLYVVSTPIGNLRDITLRALEILATADVIACEDTRVTGKLLNAYNIKAKMVAYHEHNAAKMRPQLIAQLENDAVIALVSDAGTPLVSDPGFKLVQACIEKDLTIYPVPGASSIMAGLVAAGLPTDKFYFGGFLPGKTVGRKKALEKIKTIPGTLVFFEAAPRLLPALQDMQAVLGDRQTVVTRELTKKFEEKNRGTLSEQIAYYKTHEAPLGEIVILIATLNEKTETSDDEINALLEQHLKTETLRDAVNAVTAAVDVSRQKIYEMALILAKKK